MVRSSSFFRSVLTPTFEYQRRIDAAKCKVVGHAKLIRKHFVGSEIVQFATALVHVLKVDGGSIPVVVHHFDTEPGFEGSTA